MQRSFNPLPPPKRGETIGVASKIIDGLEFQSTPPAEARGDLSHPAVADPTDAFQSTPPAEARGDFVTLGIRCESIGCFNPLPPPKRGETLRKAWADLSIEVSIHSPRRSEGRRPTVSEATSSPWFQSTPPAEARGDDW